MCTIQSRTSLSSACAIMNEWADEEGLDAFENSDIYSGITNIKLSKYYVNNSEF